MDLGKWVFAMIHFAMETLEKELQAYMTSKLKPDTNFTYAKMTPLVDENGAYQISGSEIGLSLVNIEEERVLRNVEPVTRREGLKVTRAAAPTNLLLHVLLAANAKKYYDSLRNLALALTFFQDKRVFTPENTPSMAAGLARLSLELQSPTYEQMNQLWGALGAKYLPSALFLVKMVPLGDEEVESLEPLIVRPDYRGLGSPPAGLETS
jgi:hypothetical protein